MHSHGGIVTVLFPTLISITVLLKIHLSIVIPKNVKIFKLGPKYWQWYVSKEQQRYK